MSLHQDFVQLCNKGTFNSNCLSPWSDFALSPWKEESGTAQDDMQMETFPRIKGWPVSLLSFLHTFTCHPWQQLWWEGKSKELPSTTFSVRTFTLCSLSRLHQPDAVPPVPPGTSGDLQGEISLGKWKISPFWGAMEKQPRSWDVCKCWEDEANRLLKLLAPGSASAPQPQASNSHMCAFTLARKNGVIINSQGCEVLEQEKTAYLNSTSIGWAYVWDDSELQDLAMPAPGLLGCDLPALGCRA